MKTSAAPSAVVGRVPAARDITAEEAAEWVTEEFHTLGDIHAIEARIGLEASIVAENEHRAHEFPMTQFAHETLLAELRIEYSRLALAMVSAPRTLH
ncbi:hypothetical protein D3C71_481050 [compost metagenome]